MTCLNGQGLGQTELKASLAKADELSALEEAGDTWLLAARREKKRARAACYCAIL